jgi:hypothetical protein
MHTKLRSRLAAIALLGVALACGGGTEPLAECTEPVDVSVTTGTTPTISWTPACGVGYLAVRRPLPPSLGVLEMAPVWIIRANERLIGSPVRYGIRPRGTSEVVAPEALLAGRPYDVVVDMSGQGVLGGRAFTP